MAGVLAYDMGILVWEPEGRLRSGQSLRTFIFAEELVQTTVRSGRLNKVARVKAVVDGKA